MAIDPVCKMKVDEAKAAAQRISRQDVLLLRVSCKRKFDEESGKCEAVTRIMTMRLWPDIANLPPAIVRPTTRLMVMRDGDDHDFVCGYSAQALTTAREPTPACR
jgi:hypothetical protein